jgi:dynein heavy chain
MNNVDKFLDRLKGFKAVIDEGKVSKKTVDATRQYLALEHFNRWACARPQTRVGTCMCDV